MSPDPSSRCRAELAADGEVIDAHERVHASDIIPRFRGCSAASGQITLFELIGDLFPGRRPSRMTSTD